jgi:superfamily I DNA and/or RNA helicase
MIVGDANQLPPTTFFKRRLDEADGEESEDGEVEESILEMAQTALGPKRRLTWHYRSRHSALIEYSNKVIYEDSLVVFPSPAEARPGMGVELVKVPGLYKSGQNPVEAQAMVEAAMAFVKANPERSLGLVTLNQKQMELVLERLDLAIAADPEASDYESRWLARNDGLERLFVKNLENVQGDERDCVIIGTVYGPERAGGPVPNRFGPVAGAAGRRRLNVLFTRAKERIITITSMEPDDIKASEDSDGGVAMLKGWLRYSAAGGRAARVAPARVSARASSRSTSLPSSLSGRVIQSGVHRRWRFQPKFSRIEPRRTSRSRMAAVPHQERPSASRPRT